MFPKLIIFDLDGTLIDSIGDIAAALNRMLAEFDRPTLDIDAIRMMVGDGAPTLVARALNGAPIDQPAALKSFLAHYGRCPVDHTMVYPGVRETLANLSVREIPLIVCTNKPEQAACDILRQLGLSGYFRRVIGGDTFPWRKPDARIALEACEYLSLAPDQALFIGDSEVDAATAKNAGMRFVLMTYGYHRQSVDRIEYWASLDHFDDLAALLSSEKTHPA